MKSFSALTAMLAIVPAVSAAVQEAADPRNIQSNEYLTLTSASAPIIGGNVDVAGQLTVDTGSFGYTPENFTLHGDGTDLAIPGGTLGEHGQGYKGHAYFNSGTIGIGTANIGRTSVANPAAWGASSLFVNTPVIAGTVNNGGIFKVGNSGSATVTGAFNNVDAVYLEDQSTITAGTFSSTTPTGYSYPSSINGYGTISAGTITLDGASLNPDGSLAFNSPAPVSLVDTSFIVDVLDFDSEAIDKLTFTGDVTLGGTLTALFFGATESQVAGKQFEIIEAANILGGAFDVFMPELLDIFTDDFSESAGQMELVYTPTSVYFEFVPVPEPVAMAAVGLVGVGLLRRRRS